MPDSSHQPSSDVLAAKLAAETVLLDLKSKNYFRLNATASMVWGAIERGLTLEQVVDELCAEFDAPRTQVEEETRVLLAALAERGLVGVQDREQG